jgi:dTDP-4-dehydrorhamnose reductase
MKVLITGSGGQVGHELLRQRPGTVEVYALSHADCDITDAAAVSAKVSEFRPNAIINASAFTDVDGAESNADAAFSSNRDGAANLAAAAKAGGAQLIHISTDYVFDGSASTPYAVNADPAPLSVYGASKLAGEREVLQSGAAAMIVRSGWIYSDFSRNFLLTMLRLLRAAKPVRVVSDQIGTPTSAADLADFLWRVLQHPPAARLLHWSNRGIASWYDFAVAIGELARQRGMIDGDARIEPVSTGEYYAALSQASPGRTFAERPRYSVLDCRDTWNIFGEPRHWRDALAETLDRIQAKR